MMNLGHLSKSFRYKNYQNWLLYVISVYDGKTVPDKASGHQERDVTAPRQGHKAEGKYMPVAKPD